MFTADATPGLGDVRRSEHGTNVLAGRLDQHRLDLAESIDDVGLVAIDLPPALPVVGVVERHRRGPELRHDRVPLGGDVGQVEGDP